MKLITITFLVGLYLVLAQPALAGHEVGPGMGSIALLNCKTFTSGQTSYFVTVSKNGPLSNSQYSLYVSWFKPGSKSRTFVFLADGELTKDSVSLKFVDDTVGFFSAEKVANRLEGTLELDQIEIFETGQPLTCHYSEPLK